MNVEILTRSAIIEKCAILNSFNQTFAINRLKELTKENGIRLNLCFSIDGKLTEIEYLLFDNTTLTPAQIAALQKLLNQITSNCIGMALINSLINNGHQFDFSINNSINSQAFYNATDNTITLRDPSQLTSNSLMEELYHAYQNFTYPGGTAQYAGKSGNANIEYEFKVLNDMISSIYGGTTLGNTATNMDNYKKWIGSLTNYTSVPNSFNQTQYSFYFIYMNEFYQNDPNHIINYNLYPTTIFSLISHSECSN